MNDEDDDNDDDDGDDGNVNVDDHNCTHLCHQSLLRHLKPSFSLPKW